MRWCNILSTPPITPTSIHQSNIFGNKCEVNKESFELWPLSRLTNSYKGFYGEDRKVEHCICLGTQKASPILFRRVAQRKRGTNIVIQQNTHLLVTYRLFTMRTSAISTFFRALPVAKETNFTSNSVTTSLWPWRIATSRENHFDFDTFLDLPCVLSLSLKISGGLLL